MTETVVSFRALSHSFGKGTLRRQVLFDLAGDVKSGEIVVVTGPSGSGKTTLLTLLGGLRRVQAGELVVLGCRMETARERQLRAVRRGIGYIFQSHNLIDALTATQNLLLSLRLHKDIEGHERMARDMLAELGLGDFADRRPGHLSGGQRQRVAVARALVASPRVVLADEPTASLDGATGHAVVQQLRLLAKHRGTAIVMVTHDNRMFDVADRIISMHDGRFASAGEEIAPVG